MQNINRSYPAPQKPVSQPAGTQKDFREAGFASLLKWSYRHLFEQARQLSARPFDAALCGYYIVLVSQ